MYSSGRNAKEHFRLSRVLISGRVTLGSRYSRSPFRSFAFYFNVLLNYLHSLIFFVFVLRTYLFVD